MVSHLQHRVRVQNEICRYVMERKSGGWIYFIADSALGVNMHVDSNIASLVLWDDLCNVHKIFKFSTN